MQGKKDYQPKLYNSFNLTERIPVTNFYKRLKEILDLRFLYKETAKYYGNTGQKSIDPVVFFKICLVGYLENIISDRQVMEHCSLRMDILYFLDHDIDEELPWHSTISRTGQLYPDHLFDQLFEKVLRMCVEKGMVAGRQQAIDSAFVKANASMDSLELKVPEEELEDYIEKVRVLSTPDRRPKAESKKSGQSKNDKSSKDQRTVSAFRERIKRDRIPPKALVRAARPPSWFR